MAKRAIEDKLRSAAPSSTQIKNAIPRFSGRIKELEQLDVGTINSGRDPQLIKLETAIESTITSIYPHDTYQYKRLSPAVQLDCTCYEAYIMLVGLGNAQGPSVQEIRSGVEEGKRRAIALLEEEIKLLNEQLNIEADTSAILSNLASDIALIERLLRGFHRIARQLKHRHGKREGFLITDEYDVQDLLHSILRGLFSDVRAEESTPSYAGGSSRMDFLLKSEQIVIETKMTRSTLQDKQIGDELMIDISRYHIHPDCRFLICFVYDPNCELKNPSGLEADLSKLHGKLNVKVIIVSPS